MENYYEDTKALRKNMFICQHEREDHVLCSKLLRMGWASKRMSDQSNDDQFGVPSETFPEHCRALKNTDILEQIVMHITDSDLLNCRLVCKEWSVNMAYFLSKRKSLVVSEDHCLKAENLLKKRRDGQPIALSRLGLFAVSTSCALYKRLFEAFGQTLSNISLEGCNLSPADLRRIFFVDAPNIEKFHFREEFPPNIQPSTTVVKTFKQIKILNNGSLYLPRMKMLHWDELNGQTELKEIIEACPNLITLELRNFPLPRSNTYRQLKCDSLRHLFLSPKDVLDHEHCKALSYLNLKLKKLTLFGLNSSDRQAMKSLSKFLSTISESLQFLELWLDYGSVLSHQGFEQYSPLTVFLPKVTKLHTESAILGHINNVRKLPAITELEIVSNYHEVQNWTALTKRTVTTTHTNSLRSFRCGDIDCKSLEKVMKVLPHITSLNIYASNVDDKLLRSLFTNLTLLKEFTISPCFKTQLLRISDTGITGIQAGKCAKLRKNLSKLENLSVEELSSQPHIGNLQSLQVLDLSFSVSDMITDISILFGISKLPKLNTLKLPICRITDTSLSIVQKRLEQLNILSIAGCKQITSKAITDFKQQRKGIQIDVNLPPEVLEKFS